MKIEGQTFLNACNDIMLTPELEWTIVVEQPVEPPGERARRSRKGQNLMGPCPRSVSDKALWRGLERAGQSELGAWS